MPKTTLLAFAVFCAVSCKSASPSPSTVKDAESDGPGNCSITDETLTNPGDPNDSCTVTTTVGGGGSCCGANSDDGCAGRDVSRFTQSIKTINYDSSCSPKN